MYVFSSYLDKCLFVFVKFLEGVVHIYGAVQCNNIELIGLSEPMDFFMSILDQCDWINFI